MRGLIYKSCVAAWLMVGEEVALLACCILWRAMFLVSFLARQFIFPLADGSPQHTGFAIELSWSPAVIDGTSRSLCLCF